MTMGQKARSALMMSSASWSVMAVIVFSAGAATAASPGQRPAADTALSRGVSLNDDIVVTGSRIVRDGYEAPTPVTVLGQAEIQASAPTNIADLVNQLPSVAGSTTPTTNPSGISGGYTGINSINLRNLGSTRTLILLDGKRVPYSNLTTGVDINNLPNALIKRVDVVTAGASAVYGSDAVSGVVNFILDKEFTGIKGNVQGGVTTHGDNESYMLSLTYGTKFAKDRGHFLISAEHAYVDGIRNNPRSWYNGRTLFTNPSYTPTNGQPEYLVMDQGAPIVGAPGAIITSGPLAGIYFGANGQPAMINYGPIVSGGTTIGSPDWRYFNIGQGDRTQDMAPEISRQSVFTRVSYDITDDVQLYGQFSYGRARTFTHGTPQYYYGNLTIQRDNAFLPAEIAARMSELGLSTISIGTTNEDLGGVPTWTARDQYRYMVGAAGQASLFGTDWAWDLSFNKNISDIYQSTIVNVQSRYRAAIDAVRDANGTIVCRSTLASPNNGCVPYNILGTGTSSEAARNYVSQLDWLDQTWKQDIYAASMRGEPVSTWAGPVSVAFGVEHRQEELTGEAEPLGLTNGYWAGNYKATNGSNKVTEGFLETVIPLAKDVSWAKALDINAAIRGTDYSNSGYVTTWKLGLSWSPVDDIRFRATRSRDIRAPNLVELFQPGLTRTFGTTDPFTNEVVTYYEISGGNPDLKPENADTWDLGVILQPGFLPGLSASVDYFDINIKDALGSVGNPLQRCYDGEAVFCSLIDRDANGNLVSIRNYQINIASRQVRGLDFEVSYRMPVGNGTLTLRGMATRYLKSISDNGLGSVSSSLGANLPKWQYRAQAVWQNERVTFGLVGRGLSALRYNSSYIVCTTSCPASTPAHRTINVAGNPGVFYVDLNAAYKLTTEAEWFVAVSNLFDKDPPARGGTQTSDAPTGTYPAYHDIIGRTVKTGVRFQF